MKLIFGAAPSYDWPVFNALESLSSTLSLSLFVRGEVMGVGGGVRNEGRAGEGEQNLSL